MLSLSVNLFNALSTSKNKMYPQNKILGFNPFYFYFIVLLFILNAASIPPFYLNIPDGGYIYLYLNIKIILIKKNILKIMKIYYY